MKKQTDSSKTPSEPKQMSLILHLLTLVLQLFRVIIKQSEEIQQLKDEIARLKKQKTSPKVPPSRLEKDGELSEKPAKRPGSKKRKKTEELEIHETKKIPPEDIPEGSKLKDYQDYVVQGIVIRSHNILYRLERWETPSGEIIIGKLPESVQGSHYSPTLVTYILSQYYQCHVTQPLLLEQLHEFEIDISAGQLSRILIENKDNFHQEKAEILSVGLQVSSHVNVDDTGARHDGKNGVCTHIGNEFFAWFESTNSKSRINFLELLRCGFSDYVINDDALEYMEAHKLPKSILSRLEPKTFSNKSEWESYLKLVNITQDRHVKIATEGALFGSVLAHGVPKDLVVVSDDAGQFNILVHGLCWIHSERTIKKVIPLTDSQQKDQEMILDEIWKLYRDLKTYKTEPPQVQKQLKPLLEACFDRIFTTQTCDPTLNETLKRIHRNKSELLLVLERPEIPLHNNLSESDIREYVKRRKVSGSTRSKLGKKARDTFTSLKKTCKKLGISFWEYLQDRISKTNKIPKLSELVRQQSQKIK